MATDLQRVSETFDTFQNEQQNENIYPPINCCSKKDKNEIININDTTKDEHVEIINDTTKDELVEISNCISENSNSNGINKCKNESNSCKSTKLDELDLPEVNERSINTMQHDSEISVIDTIAGNQVNESLIKDNEGMNDDKESLIQKDNKDKGEDVISSEGYKSDVEVLSQVIPLKNLKPTLASIKKKEIENKDKKEQHVFKSSLQLVLQSHDSNLEKAIEYKEENDMDKAQVETIPEEKQDITENEGLESTKDEMFSSKEDLKCPKEEILNSNEDLKCPKEEILNSNEDLKCSKEELLSSKEDLISSRESVDDNESDENVQGNISDDNTLRMTSNSSKECSSSSLTERKKTIEETIKKNINKDGKGNDREETGTLLVKRKSIFGGWQRYFSVLQGYELNCYKSKDEFLLSEPSKMTFDLTTIGKIRSKKPGMMKSQYPFNIYRMKQSTVRLAAETLEEREKWNQQFQKMKVIRNSYSPSKLTESCDVVGQVDSNDKKDKVSVNGTETHKSGQSKDTKDTSGKNDVLIKPRKLSQPGFKIDQTDLSVRRLSKLTSKHDKTDKQKYSVAKCSSTVNENVEDVFGVTLKSVKKREKSTSPEPSTFLVSNVNRNSTSIQHAISREIVFNEPPDEFHKELLTGSGNVPARIIKEIKKADLDKNEQTAINENPENFIKEIDDVLKIEETKYTEEFTSVADFERCEHYRGSIPNDSSTQADLENVSIELKDNLKNVNEDDDKISEISEITPTPCMENKTTSSLEIISTAINESCTDTADSGPLETKQDPDDVFTSNSDDVQIDYKLPRRSSSEKSKSSLIEASLDNYILQTPSGSRTGSRKSSVSSGNGTEKPEKSERRGSITLKKFLRRMKSDTSMMDPKVKKRTSEHHGRRNSDSSEKSSGKLKKFLLGGKKSSKTLDADITIVEIKHSDIESIETLDTEECNSHQNSTDNNLPDSTEIEKINLKESSNDKLDTESIDTKIPLDLQPVIASPLFESENYLTDVVMRNSVHYSQIRDSYCSNYSNYSNSSQKEPPPELPERNKQRDKSPGHDVPTSNKPVMHSDYFQLQSENEQQVDVILDGMLSSDQIDSILTEKNNEQRRNSNTNVLYVPGDDPPRRPSYLSMTSMESDEPLPKTNFLGGEDFDPIRRDKRNSMESDTVFPESLDQMKTKRNSNRSSFIQEYPTIAEEIIINSPELEDNIRQVNIENIVQNDTKIEINETEEGEDYFPSFSSVEIRNKQGPLLGPEMDKDLRSSGILGLKEFLRDSQEDDSELEGKVTINRLGHSVAVEKLRAEFN